MGRRSRKKWVHDEVQRGREKSKPNGKSEGEPIFDLPKGAWESGRGIAFSAGSYITKKNETFASVYTAGDMQVKVGWNGGKGGRENSGEWVSIVRNDTSKRPERC